MTSFMESRTSPRPHRRRWPARPDLGEWGHSRLVATAAGDLSCSSKVLRRPHTSPLRYCVFGSLYRPSPDDLPSRLRLEYCWLLCERIDAAPLLCGGLLDDNEFGESGHKEGSRFLVPRLMTACDLVCHPRVCPDPFGPVVIEAMRGRTVTATRGGGPS